MDILAKVPTMPDGALGNLHANAERLRRARSPVQRTEAAALLLALEAELAARRAAKLERAAQARHGASALRAADEKLGSRLLLPRADRRPRAGQPALFSAPSAVRR